MPIQPITSRENHLTMYYSTLIHSLKLVKYYKDIPPGVVFIDAQVLLDKITELVEYSIELRAKPSAQILAVGSIEKFKICGIVTTEILSQFSSGYVPGLFEENHLRSF